MSINVYENGVRAARHYLVSGLIGSALWWPAWAYAHSIGEAKSFTGGFMHPLLGPDHLLAMLSVGIISALIGGWAILWVPGAFVTAMIIGGTLGVLGINMPHMEVAIAVSVLLLGLGITRPKQFPIWITICVVALFGIFHGNAHGVEMPRAAVPVFFTLGFIFATALVHLTGVGIGFIPWLHVRKRLPMTIAGATISIIGGFFLIRSIVSIGSVESIG